MDTSVELWIRSFMMLSIHAVAETVSSLAPAPVKKAIPAAEAVLVVTSWWWCRAPVVVVLFDE